MKARVVERMRAQTQELGKRDVLSTVDANGIERSVAPSSYSSYNAPLPKVTQPAAPGSFT